MTRQITYNLSPAGGRANAAGASAKQGERKLLPALLGANYFLPLGVQPAFALQHMAKERAREGADLRGERRISEVRQLDLGPSPIGRRRAALAANCGPFVASGALAGGCL